MPLSPLPLPPCLNLRLLESLIIYSMNSPAPNVWRLRHFPSLSVARRFCIGFVPQSKAAPLYSFLGSFVCVGLSFCRFYWTSVMLHRRPSCLPRVEQVCAFLGVSSPIRLEPAFCLSSGRSQPPEDFRASLTRHCRRTKDRRNLSFSVHSRFF